MPSAPDPASRRPEVDSEVLRPCPRSPNCVCSDDPQPSRRVAALAIRAPSAEAWRAAAAVVSAWPRTRVVHHDDHRLHVECRSLLFRFVDDLELLLRPGEIAVRSASRAGWSDLGVNRRRVARLRRALQRKGVVAATGPAGG